MRFLFYLVEICGVGNVWQVRWDSERTIAHLGKPRAGLDQMILDNLYQQMEDHTPKIMVKKKANHQYPDPGDLWIINPP
jgi:hypothetical protein